MADLKLDKNSIFEIAIGTFISGLLLILIAGLVGGYLASLGGDLHGKKADGSNFEG